jgi:phosphoribosylanthranilate isomerase
MNLKTNVKLGEVTNLSDARFAAGRGAQFVGFALSPEHRNYLSPEKVQEISGWVDGPSLVGEWISGLPEVIADTQERLQLDYVQLNRYDPALASAVSDLCLIQCIGIEAWTTTSEIIRQINGVHLCTHHFMLCCDNPDVQEQFLSKPAHAQLITELCRDYPIILNWNFTKENLAPILEKYNPFGINLKGGTEDKPGLKDFDTLNELMDLLES